MAQRINVGLPFDAWTPEDKVLWGRAFEGEDLFGPEAAKLAPSTKYGQKAACSLFLGFICDHHPALQAATFAQRVTPDIVQQYVECLQETCRGRTVESNVSRLSYALKAMCPDTDWDWVYRIARRIAARATPIRYPQVLSSDLHRLGMRGIKHARLKAKAKGRITQSCAIEFRDGLIIAALVEAPMRRKPFSLLQIDEHVIQRGQRWYLTVPAELTKTKVAQDYELSEELSEAMSFYLREVRPTFPGADTHKFLWPSENRPMTDKMIRRRTIKWTEKELGVAVSPHRFRHAAATFISVADPERIRIAKDLLGHRSFTMTEKHYIDGAQSRSAGMELEQLLNGAKPRKDQAS